MSYSYQNNQLFEKAAVFTDIHFGKKNNSREHNIDCENFVHWFCETAKEQDCDVAIFCGDWHDTRRHINVSTMNYTISNIEYIAKNFKHFYFIPGNHDLYYREKREINSIEFARNIPNVTLIYDPVVIGNVGLVPWLVEDEWQQVPNMKCKYMFGHFELPNFLMNAMVKMPDYGKLKSDMFGNQELVFSGHFHKRQKYKNVWYMGNCFPHNFSDTWDDDRGMMVLEWNKEPEFIIWPEQPTYKTILLSTLMQSPIEFLVPKSSLRVTIDAEISFEEIAFLKESFYNNFQIRKLEFIQQTEHEEQDFNKEIEFQSVDQIVIEGLDSVDSSIIDKNILIEIYNSL